MQRHDESDFFFIFDVFKLNTYIAGVQSEEPIKQ